MLPSPTRIRKIPYCQEFYCLVPSKTSETSTFTMLSDITGPVVVRQPDSSQTFINPIANINLPKVKVRDAQKISLTFPVSLTAMNTEAMFPPGKERRLGAASEHGRFSDLTGHSGILSQGFRVYWIPVPTGE